MESFTTAGEARTRIQESLSDLTARLESGEFDLVSIGRSLISDPDWVNKIRAGDFNAIRPFMRQDIDYLEWDGVPQQVPGQDTADGIA
jgi:2,4-dienoyl-CoA reductase-like NADH-dependent reductase (Old Yellow Enzyme family)